MRGDLAWQAPDMLARRQLCMVRELAAVISLTEDDRRRALNLSDRDWQAWTDFVTADGPMPTRPPLPDMLMRLGETAFHLSLLAERRSAATG